MNTGDIILLNCISNLKRQYQKIGISEVSLDELIVEAIFLVRELANTDNETNMSALTKSATFFEKTQKAIGDLTERYEINRE